MDFQLFAQAAAVAEEPAWYDYGLIGFLLDGGFFMWPIMFCAVLALAVIIERFRSLMMLNVDTRALREKVLGLLQANKEEEALELCSKERGPVPAVLSAGLRQYVVLRRLKYDPAVIQQQVDKAMEDYGVHIVAALEKHLPILGTIASVAPMIGFLGTVQGMVISFGDIVAKLGSENIVKAAAGGIMVALLTTVFGLIVGIPAFTAYNYFTSVINRYVLDVEETAAELIEAVTLQNALSMQKTEAAGSPRQEAIKAGEAV